MKDHLLATAMLCTEIAEHKDRSWTTALTTLVLDSYNDLVLFSNLIDSATEVKTIQLRHRDDVTSSDELPEELLYAILKFRDLVDRGISKTLAHFETAVISSRLTKTHFRDDESEVSQYTHRDPATARQGAVAKRVIKKMRFLVHTLIEDRGDPRACGLPLLLDEIRRLLDAEEVAEKNDHITRR